jgi:hypothetical protein
MERPYFVSTLGLEPEPFLLNNWHVQPICQRPNRFPPERCAFSPEQITHGCGPVCPRNLSKLQRSLRHCQPWGITRLPQFLHTCENSTQGSFTLLARNETHLPTEPTCQFSARAHAEAFKLEKRSLGGSCADAKTLRGALSPNANPVAGADFLDLLL